MESEHSQKKRRSRTDQHHQQIKVSELEKLSAELDTLRQRYKQLKAVYELQNLTVRHFMHNMMSPLSAASGYLELLSNNIGPDADSGKLQRYNGLIGDGLNEVGFLLEQLHDIYKDENTPGKVFESPVVELNWLINEVKGIVENSPELRTESIKLKESQMPVYVEAEIFQLKLMVYNLVTTADCFSSKTSSLEIEVSSDESAFALRIRSTGENITDKSIRELFKKRDIVRLTDNIEENSSTLLGLKICAQIAGQMGGTLIMDKRDKPSPQFIFSGPMATILG